MKLAQEHPEIYPYPWRILVTCVLCNKTRGTAALDVALRLFRTWPTPEAMGEASLEPLARIVAPLGLQRRRAARLRDLSREYIKLVSTHGKSWSDTRVPPRAEIEKLPGVGRYAADAWSLLVEGDTSIVPQDEKLAAWLDGQMGSGEVGFD